MSESLADEVVRLRAAVERLEARRVRRTSPGTAVAMLALVVALSGGTAYAAATVGTADLKDSAVTTPKLAAAAVKSAKIATSAVTNSKLAAGAVGTGKLAANAVRSGRIANGQVRAADLGTITRRSGQKTIEPGQYLWVTASCGLGEIAIAGGHVSSSVDTYALDSERSSSGDGWSVGFRNTGTRAVIADAYAYCLRR